MAADARSVRRLRTEPSGRRRIVRRRDAGLPGAGRIRWDRLGRIGFVILVAVILASYVGPLVHLGESVRLRSETGAELQAARAENEILERRANHLKSDAVLEREARRQGMVFPGEQPYVIDGVGR